jgi:hypothetical protein
MTELSQRDQSLRVESIEPTRKITGTHLSVSTVQMSLKFVLHAATSLRAAASVFQMVQGQCEAAASHTTIRNLILRIGLYEISRPRPLANDWIWIVDHTIQAGTTKCFLVLGIRQVDYLALQRPLEHQDMDMLALIPVETSTGPIVHQQFTELAARCGVPLAILSDRGSDLKKGVELLQQDHPDVIGVYDVVHLVSGLTDKILKSDEQWSEFRKDCCGCANTVRQSHVAHLKPPTPKTKARHMNIDREIRWGARMLSLLNDARSSRLSGMQQRDLPLSLLEEKFAWLDGYVQALHRWEELSGICQQTCSIVRRFGYDGDLAERLRALLPCGESEAAKILVSQVVNFGAVTAASIGSADRVPGSSEVIESLIGKGKRLAGRNGSTGMTAQVLSMATAVTSPTPAFISNALKHIGIKQLQKWTANFLPKSLQSKRQRDLPPTKVEQNLRKPITAPIPSF